MKNLSIAIAVILMFAVCGCGTQSDFGNSINTNNCISLSGGLKSNITGTWKVDANATSYPNEVFNFSTDTKGHGDGVCTGMGPCYNPYANREVRWSVSGNIITLTSGEWYTDGGVLKYWVYQSSTNYWEIKPNSPNTLTLEYYNSGYNNCTAPFNSARQ